MFHCWDHWSRNSSVNNFGGLLEDSHLALLVSALFFLLSLGVKLLLVWIQAKSLRISPVKLGKTVVTGVN